MKAFSYLSLLFLSAIALLSCGSSRHLTGINVSPATADAQSYPGGQVPFAATGIYSQAPSPQQLDANSVTWCVGRSSGTCDGNVAIRVTVQNGVAQCNQGFTGTVTILAGTQPMMSNPDGGSQLKVFGTAQLTCP